ncbi:unnamed protein product [Adineta ricciae]|uniref:Uncharacterized protein n=1 Tax=Adineta ricciae TaxID=249248 RepID=A0A815HWP0_ADIRI|nr:unnamed protein product [Adineta ricciae]CAF1358139.1 unnamed protein product [Adineta ricciae]
MVSVKTIEASAVFAWFMLMMLLRRIVLLIVAGVSGRNRPFPPGRVPEDKILKRTQVHSTNNTADATTFTKDVRVNKTIVNDAENDTYFLILLLATAIFSDTTSYDCTRTIVYSVLYLFFRIVYAVAYIFALQPWRTIAYVFGLACTLACNLDLVITLSRRTY